MPITFENGETLTAAELNALQIGLLQTTSNVPLTLTGNGVQLTVAGTANIGMLNVSGPLTTTSLTVTGSAAVPTAPLHDISNNIANTAWVANAITAVNVSGGTFDAANVSITGGTINGVTIGGLVPSSGTFTSLVAPTSAPGTNTTTVATTAFVLGQAAQSIPVMDGTGAIGSSSLFARQDHVHASDTSRAPLLSPTFTGTPVAPTANAGNSTTQLATTAFVANALSSTGSFVPSAVVITGGTINNVSIGGLTPSTGAFSSLTASTRTSGDNSTNAATTAFVANAITTAYQPSAIALTGGTINGVTVGATTPAAGRFSSITNTGAQINSLRVVTAAGAITQLATDNVLIVNKTVGALTAITLLANPPTGNRLIIKDGKGDAATNNIVITVASSGLIDGQANYTITIPYGCAGFVYNGVSWNVIASNVVTLNSITYTPGAALGTGNIIGAVAGTFVVNTSGGAFAGQVVLQGTNASSFQIVSVGGVYTIETAVNNLAAGAYSFTIQATMVGAAGSPLNSSLISLNISGEAAPGTTLTATNSPAIIASSVPGVAGTQESWTLVTSPTANFGLALNGVTQTAAANAYITNAVYWGHTFYQTFTYAGVVNWVYFNGTNVTSNQTAVTSWTACANPNPTIFINGGTTASFVATTNTTPEVVGPITVTVGGTNTIAVAISGAAAADFKLAATQVVTTVGPSITDANGTVWAITSGGQVSYNGSVTGTTAFTANVTEIAYVNGVMWQLNTEPMWYSFKTDGTFGTGPFAASPVPTTPLNQNWTLLTKAATPVSGNPYNINVVATIT